MSRLDHGETDSLVDVIWTGIIQTGVSTGPGAIKISRFLITGRTIHCYIGRGKLQVNRGVELKTNSE